MSTPSNKQDAEEAAPANDNRSQEEPLLQFQSQQGTVGSEREQQPGPPGVESQVAAAASSDAVAPVASNATAGSSSLAPGLLPKHSNPSRLPFPMKLHRILEEAEETNMTHIISWTHNGEGFKVHNKHAFEAKFIPRYFATTTYRGYHRNLNLWGFKTINRGGDRGTCWHPYFKRGREDLCRFMERVGPKGAQSTAVAGGGGSTAGEAGAKTLSEGVKVLSSAVNHPYGMMMMAQHGKGTDLQGRGGEDNDKKPAARDVHSSQVQPPPPQFLQNQQSFHPNNALWNHALASFSAAGSAQSGALNQQQLFQQPQPSSNPQLQHLLSMISPSANVPTMQAVAAPNPFVAGNASLQQGDETANGS